MNTTEGIFKNLSDSYGKRSYVIFKEIIKETKKEINLVHKRKFLHECINSKMVPRSLWFKLPGKFNYDIKLYWTISKRLIRKEIGNITNELNTLKENITLRKSCLRDIISDNSSYQNLEDLLERRKLKYEEISLTRINNRLERLKEIYCDTASASPNQPIKPDSTYSNQSNEDDSNLSLISAPPNSSQTMLVTDLTTSLNENELTLLSKGPKFALSSAVNENSKLDYCVSFCRLAHQIRWHNILSNTSNAETNEQIEKYPWSTYLKMPDEDKIDYHLEEKLRRIYSKTRRIINDIPYKSNLSNLSEQEKKILNDLKSKPFIYLPSDKGSEFCIIEDEKYIEAGFDHLNNNETYRSVTHITAKTIEKKVNTAWKEICMESHIPFYVKKSYTTTNSSLPSFYHLIKTHKEGPTLKIRPIVASHCGPTKKLSWLLSNLLSPMLKYVPAHLENSLELIENIKNVSTSESKFPCSLDVCAMYTSIPIKDAIDNVIFMLEFNKINVLKGLQLHQIQKLLTILLDNTYFSFEDKIFQQIRGLPMGSSLSGIMAILFMDTLEKRALTSLPSLPIFRRYVDDCFFLAKDRNEALRVLEVFNSQHENIKFEIEFPNDDNKTLSLLDFTVTMETNNGPIFQFYKKNAKKDLFVNYRSHLPLTSKLNFVKNERSRIKQRCTTENTFQLHNKAFDRVLHQNDYPAEIIHKSKFPKKKSTRKGENKPIFYLKMNYISDQVSKQIKREFAKEGINIRVAHKTFSIRNFLSKKKKTPACTLVRCPLKANNNQNQCFKKCVIYQVQCQACHQYYIGSTIRHLHLRIREHFENETSSILKHQRICKQKFNFSILGRATDEANLRLKEAMMIRRKKPTINSRQECEDYKNFLID